MAKPGRFQKKASLSDLSLFLVAVFLPISSCFSLKGLSQTQEKKLSKVEAAIAKNDYREAERLVLKLISKDSSNVKSYLLLSDISDELKKPEQQKRALEKVTSLDSLKYPLAFKLLGNLYFSEGNYLKAKKNYVKYQSFNTKNDSSFVSTRIKSSVFAHESILRNRKVLISSPGEAINTSQREYWPAITTNDSVLYFTRLITDENNLPIERIFFSKRETSAWSQAEELSIPTTRNSNTGTMCISADGKLLFFTACGQSDGYGSCDIYYSRKENGIWSKPINAGSVLNTPAWEAQPSVSADNRYIYFASNRKGGQGGMDIWRCEMREMKNGSLFFSNPQNPGRRINTKENDFSPFIHADGTTLFYASEGKYGMGGSDMFISKLKDSLWSEAQNLGYPINSRFSDDGLVVSPTSKVAFFSSDREGTIDRSKDLFQLELPEEFIPEKVGYMAGKVYDAETGKCIEATIEVTQLETSQSKCVQSDLQEGYITTLNAGQLYSLHVEKEGYLFYSQHVNLKNPSSFHQAERVDLFLTPIKAGQRFVLNNVFFDFDSDVLKPESETELHKLTQFLLENPLLRIEISGHTDNTGKEEYNQKLSEKRALAIVNYVSKSVDQKRLSYKGYGSSLPVSTNDTEEGKALNRRCEVKLLD